MCSPCTLPLILCRTHLFHPLHPQTHCQSWGHKESASGQSERGCLINHDACWASGSTTGKSEQYTQRKREVFSLGEGGLVGTSIRDCVIQHYEETMSSLSVITQGLLLKTLSKQENNWETLSEPPCTTRQRRVYGDFLGE